MLRRMVASLLIAGGVFVSIRSSSAEPWPRFRGPNGTGIANDKEIPIKWNDQEGILWKTPLPGVGNSSPVVWGDHLFVQTASTDAKERFLICVHAHDGKILWTRTVPGAKGNITNPRGSLASSSPATDGERVVFFVWDGKEVALHTYDLLGNQLWTVPVGPFKSQHGPGVSPMIYEDKVYLPNDQDGSSHLLCLDIKTGKSLWSAPRTAFRTCYSTPFVLEKKGEPTDLVVTSTAGVTGYNPTTGDINWNWTWKFDNAALRTVASSILSQGILFANSGDGNGSRHMVALKLNGKGDLPDSNIAWQIKRTMPYVPCMLYKGEHIYWVNDHGIAGCTESRTGKNVWEQRFNGGFTASPVMIDGKIYAFSEEGVAYVFPAATTYELLAKNSLGEGVVASPAVADNRLYVRGKEHLICIGKKNGK